MTQLVLGEPYDRRFRRVFAYVAEIQMSPSGVGAASFEFAP